MESTDQRSQRKTERFSIESILNQSKKSTPKEDSLNNDVIHNTDEEDQDDIEVDDIEEEDDLEDEGHDSDTPASDPPILLRPTPRPLMPDGLMPHAPPPASIATPLPSLFPSSLATSLSPNHILYSQWLATKNTNALFGLQGDT